MLLQYKTSIYNGFSIAMLNNQRVSYFHMLNPLLAKFGSTKWGHPTPPGDLLGVLLTCEFSTSTLRWSQTCALDEAQILGTLRIAIAQAPSPARHIHHAAVADTSNVPGARNKEISWNHEKWRFSYEKWRFSYEKWRFSYEKWRFNQFNHEKWRFNLWKMEV